ncbi:MAG: EF-Tu/IF-2/RF-3 family GTPase [Candidatus Bathyarchaeum tardum]|nr:MAG: EF-Tu/IF-2/RF-3 family GTPase [Candidatus Bathyarchaeum tardum]
MGNLTVAVLGKQGFSSNFGKKGTSTDITLYNLKKGENTVTFIEPTRYPDRLAPLFYSCSMATKAIVIVEELTATLGEQLVMLQCCGIKNGYFVLKNYIPPEKMQPLVKGTILVNYKFVEDEPSLIREELEHEATLIQTSDKEQNFGTVPVDHAFNVKGIGAVILGLVANGAINIHDTLNVLPGTKTTQIRSIQKHDDNFNSANETDRVGLALKNIKIDDVDRGTVLTNDPKIKTTKTITAQASLVKYWNAPVKTGMVLHIGHWMQVLNCTIESVNSQPNSRNPTLTLSLDKEIVYCPNDNAVLMYLEGGKLRVMGTIQLP